LGFTKPEDRFKKIYIPLMDKSENEYPETEITSDYERFVKHFPYFCNIIKCYRSEDPEHLLLNVITEYQ
jgi:hypothetical protein